MTEQGQRPAVRACPGAGDAEDDAAVIQRSRDEPEHFAVLFRRYAPEVQRYVRRRIGAGAADDVVAETFLAAFRQRAAYDLERHNARPWLYGIATNLVVKHRRSEARRIRATARLVAHQAPPADEAQVVSEAVDAAGEWQRVAVALTQLPPPERDVLLLHVWEGLPYEDVAEAVGIPVGTVRSRLNRARRRLRELSGGP